MSRQSTYRIVLAVAAAGAWLSPLAAQPTNLPVTRPVVVPTTPPAAQSMPTTREADLVQFNFPENFEIKLLIDFVSKRLGMNIMYDEAVGRKRLTVSSPARIPKDSLPGLLQSVLKMSGLMLVDGDQPGWKRIVPNQDLLAITDCVQRDQTQLMGADAMVAVTQIFELKNASTNLVEQTIKPFLSKPGGNSFSIPDRNLIIITDYVPVLRKIVPLIELVDRPSGKPTIQFIPVKHLNAGDLAKQVTALLQDRDRLGAGGGRAQKAWFLGEEPRTNQVVLICPEGSDTEVVELLQRLDVPTNAETRTYRFQRVSVQRVDQLVREYLGTDQLRTVYRATLVPEAGMMVVNAPAKVHEHIEALVKELDAPGAEAQPSYVRFYKLMNATAAQVLATVRAMDGGEKGLAGLTMPPTTGGLAPPGESYTGPNNVPAAPGAEPPKPPFFRSSTAPASQPAARSVSAVQTARTKDAMITADANTNTIIVMAPPEVQEVYRQLILTLDRRRPQVMVEVTLVTLDTSESFSLGVDLSRADQYHDARSLVFSAFGLSTANTDTGALTLRPGVGFNGLLLSPDSVNVVVRALSTSGRAKVLSAPKVLVNDNATATLSSISEAPFTSVNASDTVSTTSFAGYASAGTTITVTPHIGEGEHLQLQYAITLNSFTGEGSGGIPPPRQTNSINSLVTIPNGFTVIVGGLTRQDASRTRSVVPLIGQVPILEYLFGSHSTTDNQSTLFAFIRPVILRDDQFEDLKFISENSLKEAQLPPNLPASEPALIE